MVAEKGAEAIEKLGTNCFDVALIDYCLSDMEGTKLFQYIGATSPTTVKIMLTGKPLWDIEGVDTLLEKPIHPDALLSIVDSKLKERNIES
jgi:DNA-binding NtrC family response regulator